VGVHIDRSGPARLDGIVKGDGVLAFAGHRELSGGHSFDGYVH
jgi:hypothetical protein